MYRTIGFLALGTIGALACGKSSDVGSAADSPTNVSPTSNESAPATNPLEDPDPAEPDLIGLVPTSKKWILLTEQSGPVVPTILDVLDLESGIRHPVNPKGIPLAYKSLSPDRTAFVFSGADGSLTSQLSLVRLTPTGVVPARPVEGFEEIPAVFSTPSWGEPLRFFTITRSGRPSGVDVIDAVLGKRLGSFDFERNFGHQFAPQGYYFSYWRETGPMQHETAVSRVVADGIAPIFVLPQGSFGPVFALDGVRAFFAFDRDGVRSIQYLDLNPPTVKALPVQPAGAIMGSPKPGPTSASIIVNSVRDDRTVFSQVFVDGKQELALSDPALDVKFQLASGDAVIQVFDYTSELHIVRVEPFARHVLPGFNVRNTEGYWTTGVIGRHVYYEDGSQLRVATVDEQGALLDGPISEAGQGFDVCTFASSGVPHDKLVYRMSARDRLVVVDLGVSPPRTIGTITASVAGATLSCPSWSDAAQALTFTEHDEGGSRLQLVRLEGSTLSEPLLALESRDSVTVYALSY